MYIEKSKFANQLFPDDENRIWLESRHRVSIQERKEEYEVVGLGDVLEKYSSEEIEKQLDSLDLSYLDPLTGIQGQEYFMRKREYFENNGLVIAIRGETIEYVNRTIGYKYGNLIMYAMSRLLKSRCSRIMRTAFRGRKFLVLDKDKSLFNSVHLLLSRTCLRTPDGYEMKGIGIDVLSVRGTRITNSGNYLTSDLQEKTMKFWGFPIDTRICKIARLTSDIEWCDVYEYGKFSERIGGELLQHLLSIGA